MIGSKIIVFDTSSHKLGVMYQELKAVFTADQYYDFSDGYKFRVMILCEA